MLNQFTKLLSLLIILSVAIGCDSSAESPELGSLNGDLNAVAMKKAKSVSVASAQKTAKNVPVYGWVNIQTKPTKKKPAPIVANPCAQILCIEGTLPVDNDDDGCDDACEEPCAMVACASGFTAADTDGDGCEESCLPLCKSIKCPADTWPTDTNGDGCPNSCECTLIVDCALGYEGIDTTGNGCIDSCENICMTVSCVEGYTAADLDGDGCEESCIEEPCITVACAEGYTAADLDGDGCEESCIKYCGGFMGLTCDDNEFCEYPEGQCLSADQFGTCQPLTQFCTEEYNPVCGCDGETYSNDCQRQTAGSSLAYTGPCCEAQDAQGEGWCDMVLGVFFNGSECTYISGCSCDGSDCDAGFDSIPACEAMYGQCNDPCAAQDAQGFGLCALFHGYAFNGESCEGISGCSCEGEDCGSLYDSLEVCHAENALCIDVITPCELED